VPPTVFLGIVTSHSTLATLKTWYLVQMWPELPKTRRNIHILLALPLHLRTITVSQSYDIERRKTAVEFLHFLMYSVYSFTSIVGLPRESKILRAKHFRIGIFAGDSPTKFAGHKPPEKRRHTENKMHYNLHITYAVSSYLSKHLYHVKHHLQ
jgi:hypothetical protein